MLLIRKGPEPRWLTEYRTSPGATFNALSAEHKEQLRALLVAEQRGLCCYCMARIGVLPSSTKIEHWAPQSLHAKLVLAYSNLFASCKGGEGGPPSTQHCDTRKAHKSVTFDPTRPALLNTLKYLPSGKLESREDLQGEIDEVLGLNIEKLKRARSGAIRGLAEFMRSKRSGPWSAELLARKRQRLQQANQSEPYLGALLYWLEKKERSAAGASL